MQRLILAIFLMSISLFSCKKKHPDRNQEEKVQNIQTQDSIMKRVDEWDKLNVSNALSPLSSNVGALDYLSTTPIVQYFVKYRVESLPLLREHFVKKDSITDVDRLKYFTVFGLCQDTIMIDTLYNYANRVKAEPKNELAYTQHPYYFAMYGMELITGIKLDPFPAYLTEPDVFLNKIKEWEEKNVKK